MFPNIFSALSSFGLADPGALADGSMGATLVSVVRDSTS